MSVSPGSSLRNGIGPNLRGGLLYNVMSPVATKTAGGCATTVVTRTNAAAMAMATVLRTVSSSLLRILKLHSIMSAKASPAPVCRTPH